MKNMKIREIIKEIELYAPLFLQESYDNAGVQIGNIDQPATGVLLCVDITEDIIEEAFRKDCNLIIAHHPLIFKSLNSITGKNYIERCVIAAIRKGIVIYAAHTNLDNAENGVNHKIAQKIGLNNIEILKPLNLEQIDMNAQFGAGVIGTLPVPENAADFLCRLKEIFRLNGLTHSPLTGKMIEKVAVCGGSGAFLIPDAIASNADVFITGEAKYNDYYNVEKDILLAVIGHYESEECTKEIFFEIITKKFPNFAVHFSSINTNPVNYI